MGRKPKSLKKVKVKKEKPVETWIQFDLNISNALNKTMVFGTISANGSGIVVPENTRFRITEKTLKRLIGTVE